MARALFTLFGKIGMKGVEDVEKDLKGIEKSAKKIQKSLNKLSRNVKKTGTSLTKSLTTPIVAIAGSITLLSKKTGEYADKLLDLEQITGLSTENLQKFEHVSREAGVSFDGLTSVITKFQSRLPQIIEGSGRASEAMQDLGVNVLDTEGNLKDMNDLFPEILKSLNDIEDITLRNSIAQQIFGRSMKDLAPVLALTSEEIESIGKEAEEMGLILSKDSLQSANKFRIGMEKLKAQFVSVFRTISINFIPILSNTVLPLIKNQIIPIIIKFSEYIKSIGVWFNDLNPKIKKTVAGLITFAAIFGPITIVIGKFIGALTLAVKAFVVFRSALSLFNAVLIKNKIGLIIFAIITLITSLYLLNKNWASVVEWTKKAFTEMTHWASIFFNYIKINSIEALKILINLVEGFSKIVPSLGKKIELLNAKLDLMRAKTELNTLEHKKALGEMHKIDKAHKKQKETLEGLINKLNGYNVGLVKNTLILKNNAKTLREVEREQAELTRKAIADAKEDERKRREEAIESKKEELRIKKEFEKAWSKKVIMQTSNRMQTILQMEKDALEEAKKIRADEFKVKQFYFNEIVSLRKQMAEEEKVLAEENLARKRQELIAIKEAYIDTFGSIFELLSNFYALQIKQVESRKRKEINAINKTKMTEEQKVAAIEKIEIGADKKITDLRRKQAKMDKANAILGIVVNTSEAISRAYAEMSWQAATVVAAIIGTIGAAQIGIVASEPIPFAGGGLVMSNPGKGINAIIGEGREDEVVFPLDKGVDLLFEKLMNKIDTYDNRSLSQPFAEPQNPVVFNVGTLIADDSGIEELERRMRTFEIREDQRRGF